MVLFYFPTTTTLGTGFGVPFVTCSQQVAQTLLKGLKIIEVSQLQNQKIEVGPDVCSLAYLTMFFNCIRYTDRFLGYITTLLNCMGYAVLKVRKSVYDELANAGKKEAMAYC